MDAMNYPEPLEEVGLEIAEELRKQGKAKNCGGCEKPFTRARKWRAMKRLKVGVADQGVFSWTALICGKCKFEHEHGNREIMARINREALREAALVAATPGGTA
jgi:hypothetical protein